MSTRLGLCVLVLLPLAAACGSADFDDNDVKVRTAGFPASGVVVPVVGSSWFVYFAEEALVGPLGTDLNGDLDTSDQVAVAAKLGSKREELTGVAAIGAALAGDNVWLVVDEALDGRDWNASGTQELVLVHWDEATGTTAFVDTLDPASEPLVFGVDERVYYASADPLGAGDVTNLRSLERDMPTSPIVVANEPGGGAVRALFLGEEDELFVLSQDETLAGRDLNGDGDSSDPFVLGLLDGERRSSTLRNIRLALAGADAPWDVRRDGDRWEFGVLVNEMAQGANLNDPALFPFPLLPDGCPGDADLDDDVLFFLRFPDLEDEGGVGNTGLAGRDRVVTVEDFVATLSPELDDGGCDHNGDGDTDDSIVRWARSHATLGVIDEEPVRDPELLVATGSVPGGSFGLSRLRERFVALVDEAADGRDRDGRVGDTLLVAWFDPEDPEDEGWIFAHQNKDNRRQGTAIFDSEGDSEPYASPGWMSDEEREGRVAFTFLESVPGQNPLVDSLNNNVSCTEEAKDDDLTDALPVWLDFETGPTLDFDGTGFAVVPDAEVVVSRGFAYFRVSELLDNHDWDEDDVLDDQVLVRNPLLSCEVEVLGVLAPLPGPALIVRDRDARGGVFLSTGVDFNGDGNATELVVRHFAF